MFVTVWNEDTFSHQAEKQPEANLQPKKQIFFKRTKRARETEEWVAVSQLKVKSFRDQDSLWESDNRLLSACCANFLCVKTGHDYY